MSGSTREHERWLRTSRCSRIDAVDRVTLTRVQLLRGEGTDGDPVRVVYQWWDDEGVMVAETDPEAP